MTGGFRGSILGSAKYVEKIKSKIESLGRLREIPETQPLPESSLDCSEILDRLSAAFKVGTNEFLMKKKNNINRQLLICILKKNSECSLKQIGCFMSMDYAAVSISAIRFEERTKKDPVARSLFQRAESEIAKLRREKG